MRKIFLCLALLPTVFANTPALAEPGDILIKLRPNYWIRSGADKSTITLNGTAHSIAAQNSFGVEAAMDFFLTNELVAEVALGGASLNQQASDGSSFATSGQLAPTATLLYYPAQASAKVRPYFGGGISYVSLYSEKPGVLLTSQQDLPPATYLVEFGRNVAPVIQAGIDVSLNDRFYINLDAKYIITKYDINVSKNGNPLSVNSGKSKLNSVVLGVGIGSKF